MRCGWKQDTARHIDTLSVEGLVRHEGLAPKYGAAPARRPSSYDALRRYCDVRDQKFSSACVGFSVAGAARARLRFLGYDVERLSPLAVYAEARQLQGDGMGDSGCYPAMAMRAIRKFGLVTEDVWPFDDHYERVIEQEVPFDVFAAGSQFCVQSFSRIADEGKARVLACMDALLAGHPVLLGMQVGREFEAYAPGKPAVGVETGEDTGGHMTFLVGYEDDGEVFVGCNSWSKDYGDRGFYRIHRSKLEHASTTDLYDFVIAKARAA
jgi:hypothetical protein